ncbi:MAG TPA: DUF72 domain-containing protein [Acidimicrobiia bacterium]|jgi:uncharacterized protein YecE (DUF72 family)
MAEIRIGVSGWNYRHWRRRFYPEGLVQRRELEYAASCFGSIEINGTFYGMTRASTVRRWVSATPPEFVFAVKGSRFITHNKKLGDAEEPLANFFASGILELGPKLGPILWQLSPNFRFDPERLETFLELLPFDTRAAVRLARRHDERVKDPGFGPQDERPLRHALEIRHPSFFVEELVDIVRRHGVALAVSHASAWDYTEEVTADFMYIRLHGPRKLYDSRYEPDELADWADRIRRWHEGSQPDDARRITSCPLPSKRKRDVYVYFDNDGHAHAPHQALELQRILGQEKPRKPSRVV